MVVVVVVLVVLVLVVVVVVVPARRHDDGVRTRILHVDHEMTESVHGTERRGPRQFIGALRGAPNVFRRH